VRCSLLERAWRIGVENPVGNPGPAWNKDGIKAQDEKFSKNVKNLTTLCKNNEPTFPEAVIIFRRLKMSCSKLVHLHGVMMKRKPFPFRVFR
jgi:hypothetical protein